MITSVPFLLRALHKKFKMEILSWNLCIQPIETSKNNFFYKIVINCFHFFFQKKNCLDLMNEYGHPGSKPGATPLDPSINFHQDFGKAFEDIASYKRLIGKLLYLNTTRLEITISAQQLSQILHNPTLTDYNAVCKMIRNIEHNPGRVSCFLETQNYESSDTQMQIGMTALFLKDLSMGLVSCWDHLSFFGE